MEIKRFCGLGMLVLSSCLFVSCVDEKYDLNDVDMTLGTSSDLTLPTSSTGEIILKNIKKYPKAELQDILKMLYQNEFGPKHIAENEIECFKSLSKELQTIQYDTQNILHMLFLDDCLEPFYIL